MNVGRVIFDVLHFMGNEDWRFWTEIELKQVAEKLPVRLETFVVCMAHAIHLRMIAVWIVIAFFLLETKIHQPYLITPFTDFFERENIEIAQVDLIRM